MNNLISNLDIAKNVAKSVIDKGAYIVNINKKKEDWITHNNGIILPCYTNCRFLFPHYTTMNKILSYLEAIINLKISKADILIGLSTAGIPIASQLSARLNLPMTYVRSKPKGYGIGHLVEGNPPQNIKAVVIDDTIASGQSLITAIKALKKEYNIETVAIVTITAMSDYGFDNKWKYFQENDIPIFSLTDYAHIQQEAIRRKMITEKQSKELENFYKAPKDFKWNNY